MNEDDEIRRLRETTEILTRSVDKFGVNVEHLTASVAALTASMVTKDTFDNAIGAMRETVGRNDEDSRDRDHDLSTRIDKHAGYWDWLIKLVVGAVLLALLGLVLVQSGGVQL